MAYFSIISFSCTSQHQIFPVSLPFFLFQQTYTLISFEFGSISDLNVSQLKFRFSLAATFHQISPEIIINSPISSSAIETSFVKTAFSKSLTVTFHQIYLFFCSNLSEKSSNFKLPSIVGGFLHYTADSFI